MDGESGERILFWGSKSGPDDWALAQIPGCEAESWHRLGEGNLIQAQLRI